MTVSKKIISLLLIVTMVAQVALPVHAKEENDKVVTDEGKLEFIEKTKITNEEEISEEELFSLYVEYSFHQNTIASYGIAAGKRLTGDEKVLYDALVPVIRQIANGTRTSSMIAIGQSVRDGEGNTYNVDVEATFKGNTVTEKMLGRVLEALLADLPYELYWYDKVTGCTMTGIIGETVLQVILGFTVGKNYRGEGEYTADISKTRAVTNAVANAQEIVDQYVDVSDLEKLIGYKNEICELVSYDKEAAEKKYFTEYLDPWQMIYVFDKNQNTNVVCEGYSKAFMYLCDMTEFSEEVACYTVRGTMNDEDHMWNILTIEGQNYLVDVTNTDVGTIGQDGSLFLTGANGNIIEGYNVEDILYVYDDDTVDLWGADKESILVLAEESYNPSPSSEKCGENLTWIFDKANGALTISGTGEMYDYIDSTVPWYKYRKDITRVILGEGVQSIGIDAFNACNEIKEFVVNEKNQFYASENDVLFNKDKTCLIKYPSGKKDETYEMPESVLSIKKDAFFNKSNLKTLYFKNDAPDIEKGVFDELICDIYYPAGNFTWTKEIMEKCGGINTWKPYCIGQHNIVIDKEVKATCEQEGLSEGSHCSLCGLTLIKQQIISAYGHQWDDGILLQKQSCTSQGIKKYECTKCNAEKTETSTKLGHDYSSKWTVDKKATATANGSKSKHCTRCDAKTKVTTIYKASKVKLGTVSYVYNGKMRNPSVVIKDSKGNTISSSNYTITKPSGRKNVGKYTYTIKFKNEYSGTKKLTFKINPKGTSLSKVTAAKKAFTVKWKKQSAKMANSRITGYQIQYSTSKKFTSPKNVTVSGYSKTSKKIAKLSAKKTYYVRVRTYRTLNGTKYYSGWSTMKSVKTK